jgi:hypothetical protein
MSTVPVANLAMRNLENKSDRVVDRSKLGLANEETLYCVLLLYAYAAPILVLDGIARPYIKFITSEYE